MCFLNPVSISPKCSTVKSVGFIGGNVSRPLVRVHHQCFLVGNSSFHRRVPFSSRSAGPTCRRARCHIDYVGTIFRYLFWPSVVCWVEEGVREGNVCKGASPDNDKYELP